MIRREFADYVAARTGTPSSSIQASAKLKVPHEIPEYTDWAPGCTNGDMLCVTFEQAGQQMLAVDAKADRYNAMLAAGRQPAESSYNEDFFQPAYHPSLFYPNLAQDMNGLLAGLRRARPAARAGKCHHPFPRRPEGSVPLLLGRPPPKVDHSR